MAAKRLGMLPLLSGRPRLALVGLVLLGGFWAFDLGALRSGVPDPRDDTWEYGVAARHLLAGQGFRTSVIHPPLWALRDSASTVPLLVHGPMLPLVLAPVLRILGPSTLERMAWIAALFMVLAAVSTFRTGTRYLGQAVGACAACFVTLSPLGMRAVHHDVSPAAGAWLLALALDLLARPRPRALGGGIVMGIAYLVRPEMLLATPIMGILAGRAWRPYALGALAFMVPWWWHCLRATGSPIFNLSTYLLIGYWGGYPELSALRDFHLTPDRWPSVLLRTLPSLPAKWLVFFPHAVKRVIFAPSGGTGGLAMIGAVSLLRSPAIKRMALVVPLIMILVVLILTTTIYSERYVTPFLPLWAWAAAVGARELAARLPPWFHRTWPALAVVLILPSTAAELRFAYREARALEIRLTAERAKLGERKRNDRRLMFSDTPDFVAWYTHRPVVWVTRSEYDRLPSEESEDPTLPARSQGDTWFHDSGFWPEATATSSR